MSELHHRSNLSVVTRRVDAVVDRLTVAMQFGKNDPAALAQTVHAVDFALRGPTNRDDDDYLDIEADHAVALVRALIPFVAAAHRRPGCEGCAECGPDDAHPEPLIGYRHGS